MSKESSLKASFLDGIFASIMFGFTTNYVTPFALIIGANNFQIGLLNSIPQLFSSIVQLKSADIVHKIKNRVKTITISVFSQSFTYFIICLVFLIPMSFRVEFFIILIILNAVFGSISAPAWASLMSDTVDRDKYGEYFSWRGKVLGMITLISSFIAGFFLYIIPNKFIGFIALFLLAGLCRVISGRYLSKMDDIPIDYSQKKDFSYLQFIKRFPESNFVKFVLFVSLINFSTFLAAPFFSVYMLDELRFKYSTFTIVTSIGALAGLLSLPFWGKFADKYGNAKILKSTAKFLPIMPILWLFSKDPVYLTIINAFAGYIWAGFNLAVLNFIFDASSAEVRTRCIGYFNFTNGFFIFLGALIGGFLATQISLLTLFFVSGVARLLVNICMLDSFKEVREVKPIEDNTIIYIITGIIPALSLSEKILYKIKKSSNYTNCKRENETG